MSWPLSQDYNEAIQDPGSSFRDAELRQGEAVTNALGIPMPRSGNFADVYEVRCPGGARWAVKCFTREVSGLRERYSEISRALADARLPFTVEFTYLDEGIRVRGQWYPLLKMQWVEGFTFNEFVRNNLDKPAMLDGLLTIWTKMGQRLRSEGIAHADLQHGNVLLVPGSTANALAVKLIDYDGMYVRSLAGKPSGEVGHPSYQHPQRVREGVYGPEVDRFPLLLTATALRCLRIRGKELWSRYDNGDNLLFRENDLKKPGESALFRELEGIADPKARKLVPALRQALAGTLDKTPLLEEVLPELTVSAVKAAPVSKPVSVSVTAPRIAAKGSPAAPARDAVVTSLAFDESPRVKAASPRRARARATKMNPLLWAGIGAGAGLLILGILLALILGSKGNNRNDSKEVADVRAGDTNSKSIGNDPRRSDASKDNKKDPKDRPKEAPKDNGKVPPRDHGTDPMPDPGPKDPKPADNSSDANRLTGTFTAEVDGYTETWTIKFADDNWDISAIYTKPGEKDCSFNAEDIKFQDGKLTFIQKLGPDCPPFWRTGSAITVEVKDENSLTYIWRQGIGDQGRPRTLVKSSSTVAQPKEPVPLTPDDPAIATVQQRKEAIAKAKEVFEATTRKAEKDLVAALDQEIINLSNAKLAPASRLALVALRKQEKEAFQKSGKLPWSPVMRPAVEKYLQTRAAAERQLAATYDKVCDQTVKSGDQKRATELTVEKKRLLEPKLVGTLQCTGINFGAQFTYRLYSNGSVSPDQYPRSTWELTETNQLVLTVFRPDAPNGKIIDTCTIDSDGKTLNARNQIGQTYGAKIN